ncbi:MAG: SirB2 family protein [Chitinophagales bacterium]|nr:SirB2 family protein [Chitinophagales bacterium]MDW8272935.1 SirB2 family protein [Chitinophagales bacterium]
MSNSQIYISLLHTHKLTVLLFLLHYLIKTILLISNNKKALDKYSRPTRVPEMIVSALFLLTGVVMLLMGANINTLLLIKIVCVLASIPVAVVAFRKENKPLAVLAVLLIVTSYGLAEMSRAQKGKQKVDTAAVGNDPIAVGKKVYSELCVACHGVEGDGMLAGAKNLKISTLSHEEVIHIIRNGKGNMAAYKNLTAEQLEAVALYVESLRTTDNSNQK